MKNLFRLITAAGLLLFFSCKYPQQKPATNTNSKTTITRHLKPGKHCYVALFEKDSANLTFNITATGKISGELNINYDNPDTVTHQPTSGKISGEFRGDTLFADYFFTSGVNGKTNYINPIALLFKNDTLIMGHGKIYDYLGRTYFDDKTPISFANSRFSFTPANCK